MGVDFSSSIAYGIAIIETDGIPEALKHLDNPYEDGGTVEWLKENGYTEIGYDYCGDWMSGPQVLLFYLKGTEYLHAENGYGDVLREFDNVDLTLDQERQLRGLCWRLDMKWPEAVGWKLVNNVS